MKRQPSKRISRASVVFGRVARNAQALRLLLGEKFAEAEAEITFQMPNKEYRQLQLSMNETVAELRATIQLELKIPYEEQHLFIDGVEMDDDAELASYHLEESKPIRIVQKPRYRKIGMPNHMIKTLRLETGAAGGGTVDYQIVEMNAKLPPFSVVLKRIVRAAMYVIKLDRFVPTDQAKTDTGRDIRLSGLLTIRTLP